MKKSILITFLVIAMMTAAIPAFAVITITSAATTVIGGANFTPSTNVTVSAAALPSNDPTNPNTYCVTSVHGAVVNTPSGKAFGALNTDAAIKHYDAPATVTTCACSSSVAFACTMIQ